MDSNNLDLVETQELVEALFRRCRVGVVLLTRHRDENNDEEVYTSIGNESTALGLCEAMSTRLRLIVENQFREED
jgi:hypothetical protein